ncbi:hypothetical protein Gotri_021888, partial [Gossypium trilobum]|nr:hypothetical protein [Gossypium trilobum]
DAVFDAAQYAFFGKDVLEEVELGGLDDEEDVPAVGLEDEEEFLFDRDELKSERCKSHQQMERTKKERKMFSSSPVSLRGLGEVLRSLSDVDDLTNTFSKLNTAISGPRGSRIIGDGGSRQSEFIHLSTVFYQSIADD